MKKRVAAQKKHLYGTGGGPPMKESYTAVDEMLADIVPQKQVHGLKLRKSFDVLDISFFCDKQ